MAAPRSSSSTAALSSADRLSRSASRRRAPPAPPPCGRAGAGVLVLLQELDLLIPPARHLPRLLEHEAAEILHRLLLAGQEIAPLGVFLLHRVVAALGFLGRASSVSMPVQLRLAGLAIPAGALPVAGVPGGSRPAAVKSCRSLRRKSDDEAIRCRCSSTRRAGRGAPAAVSRSPRDRSARGPAAGSSCRSLHGAGGGVQLAELPEVLVEPSQQVTAQQEVADAEVGPHLVAEVAIALRPLDLELQRFQVAFDLGDDVPNAQQVVLGQFQFDQGRLLAVLERDDPRHLLDQGALLQRLGGQQVLDAPLFDDGVRGEPRGRCPRRPPGCRGGGSACR